MNFKIDEQDRVARYGVALGLLLHATWRGLVGIFVSEDFDPRRLHGSRADRSDSRNRERP
jgi:hypothetical protein